MAEIIPAETLIAIMLAGVVTYGLRVGGLFLADYLPNRGPLRRGMEALPGAILISLVAPNAVKFGPVGLVATLLTALTTYRTRNVFIGMAIGMMTIILSRKLGV